MVVLVPVLNLDTHRPSRSNSQDIPINKPKSEHLPSCLHQVWPTSNNLSNHSILNRVNPYSPPDLDTVHQHTPSRMEQEQEEWIKCRISFNR